MMAKTLLVVQASYVRENPIIHGGPENGAGVDPQTGEEQWVLNTQNKDGSLNKELTKNPGEAQRIIIGTPDPKLTGGWRNSLSWKGLEFNALFSFSLGGKLLDDACFNVYRY